MAPARDGPLIAAGAEPRPATAWVLTDGKIGDRVQCLGVAEAMGLVPEERVVRPRVPWSWLAPHGWPDPLDWPGRSGGALAGPFPDIVFASGRRAVPAVGALRRASAGRTFTVFLKMPRKAAAADLIWVPDHDPLRGPDVIHTPTSPSRLTRARLSAARAEPDVRLAALPTPRVAMLVGGPGAGYRFTDAVEADLVSAVRTLLADGAGVMITPSRRTPAALTAALLALAGQHPGRLFVWNGCGENPYVPMLALADALVVTADSVNMLGEAALTGAPIHLVEPPGGRPKMRRFAESLMAHGAVRRWAGHLERFTYAPLDATPAIAASVAERYAAFRRQRA